MGRVPYFSFDVQCLVRYFLRYNRCRKLCINWQCSYCSVSCFTVLTHYSRPNPLAYDKLAKILRLKFLTESLIRLEKSFDHRVMIGVDHLCVREMKR